MALFLADNEEDEEYIRTMVDSAKILFHNNQKLMDFIRKIPVVNKPANDLLTTIENVDGWLSIREALFIYYLAKHAEFPIVEIGSYCGRSTICLARGSLNGNKQTVYAIDHHQGNPEFITHFDTYHELIENLHHAKVDSIVSIQKCSSSFASINLNINNIGLLFIDGNHEYDSVKEDFLLWNPKLIKGGVIAFHDSTEREGVKQVVNEYINEPAFTDKHLIDSITFARKT